MKKSIVLVVGLLIILGGISIASFAKGVDLNVENKENIYFDNTRNITVRVIFYKKVVNLSGDNFGNLKLKAVTSNTDKIYKNEKNNLTLQKNDKEVLIFIGDKKVFEGKEQEDESYKNNIKNNLTSSVWLWNDLIIKNDARINPIDSSVFNLSFSKDGKILATTNCANYSGSYKLVDNKLEITDLNENKRFCANRDGDVFIQSLKNLDSFDFDKNGNLIGFIKNNSGSISFTKK